MNHLWRNGHRCNNSELQSKVRRLAVLEVCSPISPTLAVTGMGWKKILVSSWFYWALYEMSCGRDKLSVYLVHIRVFNTNPYLPPHNTTPNTRHPRRTQEKPSYGEPENEKLFLYVCQLICFTCGSGVESFHIRVWKTKAALVTCSHVSCVSQALGGDSLRNDQIYNQHIYWLYWQPYIQSEQQWWDRWLYNLLTEILKPNFLPGWWPVPVNVSSKPNSGIRSGDSSL